MMSALPLFDVTPDLSDAEDIPVNLRDHAYHIKVKSGALSQIHLIFREQRLGSQVLIVSSDRVFSLYGKQLLQGFSLLGIEPAVCLMPEGETAKSRDELNKVHDLLVEKRFSRDATIVAFGGGVVGDLAGFAAATYMRGINLVQVPTTLLAQVDSSIGGKTAVNHPAGKNLIGAFHQPRAVLIDPQVLVSLPAREVRTGLAEVVKYGMIDNERFFGFLEKHSDCLTGFSSESLHIWRHIIVESCKIKARVVAIDERESGLRMILNFGHTIGHALEAVSDYSRYTHGEAVAIGMTGATVIARNRGLVGHDTLDRLTTLLKKLGLPVSFSGLDIRNIIDTIKLDKKNRSGTLKFVLPDRIGVVHVLSDISEKEVQTALEAIHDNEDTDH